MNFQNINIKLKRTVYKIVFFSVAYFLLTSCEDFVEVTDPPNELLASSVFTNDETADAAMAGVYFGLRNITYYIAHYSGLTSDEFTNFNTWQVQVQFFENNILPENSQNNLIWQYLYTGIFRCNSVLEGVSSSLGITEDVKIQLEGEARFMRAFCYFYLINLYGDVPLVTTTNVDVNSNISRTDKSEIYQFIIDDLITAKQLLSDEYWTSEKVRANKASSAALLARVYLYLENWPEAETEASMVLDGGRYTLSSLSEIFLKNSSEAILQFQPVEPGYNTLEGLFFFRVFSNRPSIITISDHLFNSFEENDQRKSQWLYSTSEGNETYYYPYKYKVQYSSSFEEYAVSLRLGEQYLIRAEARAKQGNITGALNDLNIIRERAGLSAFLSNDINEVLLAIKQERRIELFSEIGHRWLDIKRDGSINEILSPIKPGWQNTDALFPIPQRDIGTNPSLEQNPGY